MDKFWIISLCGILAGAFAAGFGMNLWQSCVNGLVFGAIAVLAIWMRRRKKVYG